MNAHHTLFNKIEWNTRPDAKWLRTREELVPDIDAEVHKELHKACPAVPLLGFHALRRTVKYFEVAEGDPLRTMEELMSAMEQSVRNPHAHEIEKRLVGLATWAIDLQRPFVRAGQLNPDQTIIDLGA